MLTMSLANTSATRIVELITAVQAASPGSINDTDELAEVVAILEEAKMTKLAAVLNNARTYIYIGVRRTLLETQAGNSSVTAADIKIAALEVLQSLVADPDLLDAVLTGTVTS